MRWGIRRKKCARGRWFLIVGTFDLTVSGLGHTDAILDFHAGKHTDIKMEVDSVSANKVGNLDILSLIKSIMGLRQSICFLFNVIKQKSHTLNVLLSIFNVFFCRGSGEGGEELGEFVLFRTMMHPWGWAFEQKKMKRGQIPAYARRRPPAA